MSDISAVSDLLRLQAYVPLKECSQWAFPEAYDQTTAPSGVRVNDVYYGYKFTEQEVRSELKIQGMSDRFKEWFLGKREVYEDAQAPVYHLRSPVSDADITGSFSLKRSPVVGISQFFSGLTYRAPPGEENFLTYPFARLVAYAQDNEGITRVARGLRLSKGFDLDAYASLDEFVRDLGEEEWPERVYLLTSDNARTAL